MSACMNIRHMDAIDSFPVSKLVSQAEKYRSFDRRASVDTPYSSAKLLPPVTIGLAVYNGAELIERALDSLLAQTQSNFHLLISDNASTDRTQEICVAYARRDSRISYHRQARNIPAIHNFYWLLRNARSEYFMWAAHDDVWDPAFVEQNLNELIVDRKAVAAISEVDFINRESQRVDFVDPGTSPLTNSPRKNLAEYQADPAGNSRFYSLFRREVLA